MADYAADYCGAYFAALDALKAGGDPLDAAKRTFHPDGRVQWSDRAIANFAADAAVRDWRSPKETVHASR